MHLSEEHVHFHYGIFLGHRERSLYHVGPHVEELLGILLGNLFQVLVRFRLRWDTLVKLLPGKSGRLLSWVLNCIFLVDVIFLGVVEIHQNVPRVINAGWGFWIPPIVILDDRLCERHFKQLFRMLIIRIWPDINAFNLNRLAASVPAFFLYKSYQCISIDYSNGLSIAVNDWIPIVLRVLEVMPDLLDSGNEL